MEMLRRAGTRVKQQVWTELRHAKGDGMPTRSMVLIIDDDEEIRDILEDLLSFHGYTVVTASTVQEAEDIRQLLGFPAIGLVICDVHLSGNIEFQEGYWLCRTWKEADPSLLFVLISGDLSMKDLPAVRAGVVNFVSKPFAVEELLAMIQRMFPS
jgi:two-component system, OmpR family, response regulator